MAASRGRSRRLLIVCAIAASAYVAGCGPRVTNVASLGPVIVMEHGERKELTCFIVTTNDFPAGRQTKIIADAQDGGDRTVWARRLRVVPPYRRVDRISSSVGALLNATPGYPWSDRLHWVVSTDPLVYGIGGFEGTATRPVRGSRVMPFIAPEDLHEHVTHLVVFGDKTWGALARATTANEMARIPRQTKTLPEPMPLRDVLQMKPTALRVKEL